MDGVDGDDVWKGNVAHPRSLQGKYIQYDTFKSYILYIQVVCSIHFFKRKIPRYTSSYNYEETSSPQLTVETISKIKKKGDFPCFPSLETKINLPHN